MMKKDDDDEDDEDEDEKSESTKIDLLKKIAEHFKSEDEEVVKESLTAILRSMVIKKMMTRMKTMRKI